MKKLIVIIPIIVFIGLFFAFSLSGEKEGDLPVFHVTLADPEQYVNGEYSDSVFIPEGNYSFRFVPNGDSPKNLGISLEGQNFEFSETFILKGTPHQTGISEYYTWDYSGQKSIHFETGQEVRIIVNPNGNVRGSVSVSLIKN